MIVTVAGHKGGTGKTVTAIHLAAYLCGLSGGDGEEENRDSTLLVDGDPNHSALGWSQRGDLPFTVVSEPQAAKYARNHSHIVIDTRGRPEKEDLEALVDGCDLLVIPSTPDALALEALMLTVEELERLSRSDGYRVLLTAVPPWPVRSGIEARSRLQELEVPLFEGEIRRREAFQKAALRGVPVYEVSDRRADRAWEDYRMVGEEITSGRISG